MNENAEREEKEEKIIIIVLKYNNNSADYSVGSAPPLRKNKMCNLIIYTHAAAIKQQQTTKRTYKVHDTTQAVQEEKFCSEQMLTTAKLRRQKNQTRS